MSPRKRTVNASASERARERHAWLELVQTSGPFLTLPVVDRVFPDGLPEVRGAARAAVRGAVAQVLADGGQGRQELVRTVVREALDWDDHARFDHDVPAALTEAVPGHAARIVPDLGFWVDECGVALDGNEVDEVDDALTGEVVDDEESTDDENADGPEDAPADGATGPWRMLGILSAWGVHPLARTTEDGWTASPAERLALLLRAREVPVGLVTDGRWWAIVWAPVGGTTGVAVWDADLWSAEPETFRAFVALLERARFLSVAALNRLPEMLAESLEAAEEVTVTLGRQVRDAVEMLLATFDHLDERSGDALLAGVSDDELYDGVVTVMMRLVFLLFAEERRLLPSDDEVYDAGYGIGRLVEQLDSRARLDGEQSLEHRFGAWHRLLAVTRALHRGVAHEDLRMPAYGSGMFDPDRYPWLEGRRASAGGGAEPDPSARAPEVDDLTVLRMLSAVQYVTVGGERRKLSFRALDVEQIGYVYEGLLELEVRTADELVLGLVRPKTWPRKAADDPAELPLSRAEEWLHEVPPRLAQRLKKPTGLGESPLQKRLVETLDATRRMAILRAVGRADHLEAVVPYAGVLRWENGVPAITRPGRRYVAPSTRRASTGTHYTPRSLAEDIVVNTLQPLVYRPGPLETADEDAWKIRPSSEILDLRVADIAMGSGAFLVAACRYLADHLIKAQVEEGSTPALRARSTTRVVNDAEVEQVELDARRLVAEHCLYGVDINPLAVDMAKLSLWLVTMDRERPFGFLDDRLQCGDSLLGLVDVDQLETLHVDPKEGRRLHGDALDLSGGWRLTLARAADIRRQITGAPVVTARDVEHKLSLLADARALAAPLQAVADAVTATGLKAAKMSAKNTDIAFLNLSIQVSAALPDQPGKLAPLVDVVQVGRPAGTAPRRPLHWPLVFPEVFADARDIGFDAIVGNPPFLGGKKVSGALGDDYLAWLARWDGGAMKGNTDLAGRFVLRAEKLLSSRGQFGYITTNTLVQGDTLEVGMAQAVERGITVRRGRSSHPWPSRSANLEIVDVWASRAPVAPGGVRWLDGEEVPAIGADLELVGRVTGPKYRLRENDDVAFIGSNINGIGFTLTHEQAIELIDRDLRNAEVLQSYVIGKDLNQRPDCSASRWVINFHNWSLKRAENYPNLVSIVRDLVKPRRDKLPDYKKRVRDNWWRYEHQGPALYAAIADLDHVLAISLVGSAVMPMRVSAGPVFAHKCAIFALDDFASLAVLSSSVHTTWVVRYTSTMRTDINYSPSDVFATLPRPEPTPALHALGERLDTERRALMLSRSWGLTTTYNHVHDPADRDLEVQALRDLHAEIDRAVFDAYGWDLDPQVGHHRTKIGTRWTVSPAARFEVLDLLLEENQRRHAAETGS